MNDKERVKVLEDTLLRMLEPIKGIPFNIIIKSITGHSVIPTDVQNNVDKQLIENLKAVAEFVYSELEKNPIERPRPNEVGNDVEPYVLRALNNIGMVSERPADSKGKKQSTGYPDILTRDENDVPVYIECKIYNKNSKGTSMRSFYLSPSKNPKVCYDAKHLLLAFEMVSTPIKNSKKSKYRAVGYTLVDLHDLMCDVKYEFNSDNSRLYNKKMILAQGKFG
jgi:hypothetical protein